MIVKEGRKLIAEGKMNVFSGNIPFSKIILGTNSEITKSDMSMSKVEEAFGPSYFYIERSGDSWIASLNAETLLTEENRKCTVSFSSPSEDNELEKKLEISIPGNLALDTNYPIRSLGLIVTNDDGNDVLFSRLTFPQYTLSNRLDALVFEYYLDF